MVRDGFSCGERRSQIDQPQRKRAGCGERGNSMEYYLCDLKSGQRARIAGVCRQDDPMGRRLQDLGFVEGTEVCCLQESPLGDPTAFRVRGTVIALRGNDAARIRVESVCQTQEREEKVCKNEEESCLKPQEGTLWELR